MAIALLTLSFLAQIVYKKNRICFCVLFFLRHHWAMTVEVFSTKSEPFHLEPTKIYIVTLWAQCPWRYDNDHDHYCHYYCIYHNHHCYHHYHHLHRYHHHHHYRHYQHLHQGFKTWQRCHYLTKHVCPCLCNLWRRVLRGSHGFVDKKEELLFIWLCNWEWSKLRLSYWKLWYVLLKF